MPEQEPPVWNRAAVEQAFAPIGTPTEAAAHLVLQAGQRRVDIIGPDTVRVRTAAAFALFDQLALKELTDDAAVFAGTNPEETLELTVTRNGELTLYIGPLRPTQSDAALPLTEQPTADSDPHVQSAPEQRERQARRIVSGKVATTPDFKTLPKGGKRGHFALAEHPDMETTLYWDVFTWDKPGRMLTERLQQLGLAKGDNVEVQGYVHPVEGTTKDGKPKASMLYAAAPIKTR